MGLAAVVVMRPLAMLDTRCSTSLVAETETESTVEREGA